MSNEVLNSLLKEYEQKKLQAELDLEKRKEYLYSVVPRLKEIEDELNDFAIMTAKSILKTGNGSLVDLQKKADELKKEKIEKSKEDVLMDMPIVVLVNKNSASSSEILAGALKDLGEATIVGTTTYGKGVIQQLLSLKDGSGLKVTVEEYYTPNRTKINGVGIEPDEKVELPESVTNILLVKDEEDTQLQKAVELLSK